MKRTIVPNVIIAALAGISASFAQEPRPVEPPQRPPGAPPPAEQRPPLPPQELRDRPPRDVERQPDGDRPERPYQRDRRDSPDRRDRDPGGPGEGGGGRRIERFREMRRDATERERKPTPYIGVVTVAVPPVLTAQLGLEEGFGLVVDNVLPDSPAQAAGIQRYDVLKLLNDQQLLSSDQLSRLVQGLGKDASATLTIIRKGQEQKIPIKVGEKSLPARAMDGGGIRGFGAMGGGFGGIGGFERPMDRQQAEEMLRRMQEMGGRSREGGDPMRDMQDRMRAMQEGMQEKMRSYQDAMKRYQEQMREWQKNPSAEPPQMPQLPEMPAPRQPGGGPGDYGRPGQPGASGVRPADLLRELRPGGPGMRAEWSDGSSRWDATRARMVMRDRDGEFEVSVKDGNRVLTIKNPKGEEVFSGPVDSPEQRAAIPEQYRAKLAAMAPPPPAPSLSRSGEPDRQRPVGPPPVPRIEREPDVQ